MRRLFLIGMLCGVMMMAVIASVFTIPANTFHWQMEIWKRGGAAWVFDENGRLSWMWMVRPVSDLRPKKAIIAPSSKVNARTRRL